MTVPLPLIIRLHAARRQPPRVRNIAMRLVMVTSLLAALCQVLAGADSSFAEAPRARLPSEVYVPADQPGVWPSGRWLARPTAEYRRMRADFARQQPVPPRALLSRATYTGTFGGESFSGAFIADVQLRGSEPAYVALGEPTLAMRHLKWADQPAIWGMTPDGRSVLRVPSDGSLLEGAWSLRGRPFFDSVEFDVTLPPAVISTLELRLPTGKRLTADEHVTLEVTADPDPQWRRWVLNVGRQTQFQFAVADAPDAPASAMAFVERKSHYSLMPDGLSLEADFVFDHLAEGAESLTFTVTSGMEVTSIVLGNERELPFERIQGEQGMSVQVPVASQSMSGRLSVRVLGRMPLPAEGSWTLPRIALEHFDQVASRLYVTVHRPLELRDFSVVDCRLISSAVIAQQSDRLEFDDWSDDSQITLTWEVPHADVVADVITAVGGDRFQPTSRTLLRLRTRSGSTYELSCRVSREWQVTRVTSQPQHRSPRIASWRIEAAEDGSTQLRLEFRDALKPGDPVIIEIGASSVADAGVPIPTLWLWPHVAELRRVHVAIQPVPQQQVELPAATSFRPTDAARVRGEWSPALVDWDLWLRETFQQTSNSREPRFYVSDHPSETDVPLVPEFESTVSQARNEEGMIASSVNQNQASLAPGGIASEVRGPTLRTLTADVTIRTRVPADPGQPAIQTALYRIPHPVSGAELTFELPAPGAVISAQCAGSRDGIAVAERTIHLRLPAGKETSLVEIHYRTPFSHSFLWGGGELPLPRSELIVTDLRWQIEVPEAFRLRPSTAGTTFASRPFGWPQRLLGPLGRAPQAAVPQPRPTADEDQSQPGEPTSSEDASSLTAGGPQASSQTHSVLELRSVPFTAQSLRLAIWRTDTARHLGWMLLVVGFLTTVFAGRLPPRWCLVIKSVAIAATLLTAILVPESLAVPAGGLFLGTLTGAVLPRGIGNRQAIREREPRSVGTTRMAARALAPLWLMTLCMHSEMHAFQSDGPPHIPPAIMPRAVSDVADAMNYDVMIPVRSETATLDETSVVYVRPALLARWQSLHEPPGESPAYLLREAQYVVSGDGPLAARVDAVFDVLLLEPDSTHRITLPLTEITLDDERPCRVNGRRVTVIPLRGGGGLAVELPSVDQALLPDEDGPSSSSRHQDPEPLLQIELAFRPDPGDDNQRRPLQFGIPPLLASTVEVRDRAEGAGQTAVDGFGSSEVSDSDGQLRVELGPVRRFEVVENDRLGQPGKAAMIPDVALSSIELHPRQLAVRARLRFRLDAEAGRPSTAVASVWLPERAQVTEVKSPLLHKSRVRGVAGRPTQLQLAFAHIPAERSQVDVDVAFTLAGRIAEETAMIPAFDYFADSPSRLSTRHLVAITARSGYRVAPPATEFLDERPAPASASQFQQLWGVPGIVDPEHVFSLTTQQPFPVEVIPVTPNREASAVETLAFDRSGWRWTADVEIECRSAPVAVHRFRVDPRIRITAVRVVQEGLERRIRWFRGEEAELTLLLNEDLIGSQSVSLTGELAAVPNQLVEIPRLEIAGIRFRRHELHLQTSPGLSVEAFSADGAPLATRAADAPPIAQGMSGDRNRSFDLLATSPPQRVRVFDNVSRFDFERIVSLHAGAGNHMRMRTIFRLSDDLPLPPRIEFVVPAEWTGHGSFLTKPALTQERTREDGSAVFVLDTLTSPAIGSVEFAVTVPVPVDGLWEVPPIEVVPGTPSRESLVLSGPIRFDVEGEADDAPLDAELLEVIRLPDESDTVHRRAFTSSRPGWKLLPTPRFNAKGHVRRVESSIWDVPRFGVAGVTSWEMTLHQSQDVTVHLPSQLEVVLAVWDDVPVSREADESSSLTISAAAASPVSSPHRLAVWWKQACSPWQWRHTVPVPQIAELPVISESVAFLGSEDWLYEPGAAWSPVPAAATGISPSPTKLQISPIEAALTAAGTPEPTRRGGSAIRVSSLILRGQIDRDGRDARTIVTLWRLGREAQRVILAVLLSILAVVLWWRVKSAPVLLRGRNHTETRTFGGLLLLSVMLGALGPSLLGFGLALLVTTAWAVAVWRRRIADTTFELNSESAS